MGFISDLGDFFKPKDPPKCNDPKTKKGETCTCPKDEHTTQKGSSDCKKRSK